MSGLKAKKHKHMLQGKKFGDEESFERTINHFFKDKALLLDSLSYGGQTNLMSNQRWELIGDGVLSGLFSPLKCLAGYLNLCFFN